MPHLRVGAPALGGLRGFFLFGCFTAAWRIRLATASRLAINIGGGSLLRIGGISGKGLEDASKQTGEQALIGLAGTAQLRDLATAMTAPQPGLHPIDGMAWAKVALVILSACLWCAAHAYLSGQTRSRLFRDHDAFQTFHQRVHGSNKRSTFFLRFQTAEEERYMAGNARNLCISMRYISIALGAYVVFNALISSTRTGEVIPNPAFFHPQSSVARMLYLCAAVALLVLAVAMFILSYRREFESSPYLEHLVVSWLALVCLVNSLFFFRWFAARLQGDNPSEAFSSFAYDGDYAYGMIALILYLCVHTPLRFVVLLPLCSLMPLVYGLLASSLGSPEATMRNPEEGRSHNSAGAWLVEIEIVVALSVVTFFALAGKHRIEKQQRVSWMNAYQSFRMIQQLSAQTSKDEEEEDGSTVEKTRLALSKVVTALEAVSTSAQMAQLGLTDNLRTAKLHAEFAQRSLRRADRLFEVTAEEALRGKEFEGDTELLGFMKAHMSEPAMQSPNISFSLSRRSSVPGVPATLEEGPAVTDSVRVTKADKLAADVGETFSFNAMDLARVTQKVSLLFAAERAVVHTGVLEELNLGTRTFRSWTRGIHARYLHVLYHNEAHAAQVVANTLWLSRQTGYLEKADTAQAAALYLAAIAHDVGHIGRNNLFCSKTEHNIALIWNDNSVLENMHAATCFAVMQGEADLLQGLEAGLRKRVRKAIIRFILATDIKEHASALVRLRARMEDGRFLTVSYRLNSEENQAAKFEEDVLLAGETMLRAADTGHGLMPWEIHREWSYHVMAEFFDQGDEERSLGLPISPLCDRAAPGNIASSQAFFIDCFSSELFQVLISFTIAGYSTEGLEECLRVGQQNKERWKDEEASKIDPATLTKDFLLQMFGGPSAEVIFPYEYDKARYATRIVISTEHNLHQLTHLPSCTSPYPVVQSTVSKGTTS